MSIPFQRDTVRVHACAQGTVLIGTWTRACATRHLRRHRVEAQGLQPDGEDGAAKAAQAQTPEASGSPVGHGFLHAERSRGPLMPVDVREAGGLDPVQSIPASFLRRELHGVLRGEEGLHARVSEGGPLCP